MNNQPLVSVITIFFNEEKFIEEAIASVLAQTYQDWELLLVDDGSIDNSTKIARSYAEQYPEKIYYLEHENHQNRGMSATRNLGISKAKGEYIAFLDGDDVYLSHKLERQVNINISKAIIAEAKETQSFVAIEDLTGIRERTNQKPRNKKERRRSNSWAFYQLRNFLEYKGLKEGAEVVAVNPAYTSQTCNCCLHIGLRSNKSFKCSNTTRCGWIGDADENGSKMIALVGLSVSQPRGSQLLACPITEGLPKASALLGVG